MASEYPPPKDRSPPLSEHAARARAWWNQDAPNWVESGRRKWASPALLWGAWDVPEEELGILPDVRGLDVIELGCGTGCWSAWFARLIFLCDSVLAALCYPSSEEPVGETLVRPQHGLHRLEWPDQEAPDFHLPHGEMLRLLRRTGFEVEALHELYAPEGPADEVRYYMRRGWARRWPAEDIWVARRAPD